MKDDSFTNTPLSGGRNLVFGLNGDGATSTVLGSLNYTALGNWVLVNGSTNLALNMGAYVAGYVTPPANMPTAGTATYGGTGTVTGLVLLPNGATGAQLSGNSALTANFATGAVSGNFANIMATPAITGGAPTSWNNVAVSATIAGALLSGTTATTSTPSSQFALGNATGTVRGAFFGPTANELGAVWTLYDGARAAFGGVAGPRTVPSDRRRSGIADRRSCSSHQGKTLSSRWGLPRPRAATGGSGLHRWILE